MYICSSVYVHSHIVIFILIHSFVSGEGRNKTTQLKRNMISEQVYVIIIRVNQLYRVPDSSRNQIMQKHAKLKHSRMLQERDRQKYTFTFQELRRSVVDKSFVEQAADVCNNFKLAGYNDKLVHNCLDKNKNMDRNSLLAGKPPSMRDSKVVIATTCSPLSNDIQWFVLKKNGISSSVTLPQATPSKIFLFLPINMLEI